MAVKLEYLLIYPENNLEAFPVDNGWTTFIILLFGDPHLLEGGEGGQDGATDPYGVFPLRGSNDLDLNGGWSQGGDFLLHSVRIPGYMVVPPDMTVLAYKSLRMSTSHFMMEL